MVQCAISLVRVDGKWQCSTPFGFAFSDDERVQIRTALEEVLNTRVLNSAA